MIDSQKFSPDKNAVKNFPQKTPPVFDLWQAHLANNLNISEEELRRRRDKFLIEGEDFAKKGRRILYSISGQIKLRESLHIPLPAAQDTASQPSSTQKADAVPRRVFALPDRYNPFAAEVTLQVHRSAPHIKNVHIVEAHRPGVDPHDRRNIVRVRVASNENFIPGMELPARLVQLPDLYECTRRAPRQRGRW
jgi:hypothetical protein